MAHPHVHDERDEKERNDGPDPVINAGRPDNEEDVIEEKEIASAAMEIDDSMDEDEAMEEQREEVNRIRSNATDASADLAPGNAPEPAKKWYNNLNPLKWGAVPPVPEVRTVCPEAQAGFFNKLIFHWQASLMTVSI